MLFYLGLDPLKWALMWTFNEEGFRDRRRLSRDRRRVSTLPTTALLSLMVKKKLTSFAQLAAWQLPKCNEYNTSGGDWCQSCLPSSVNVDFHSTITKWQV